MTNQGFQNQETARRDQRDWLASLSGITVVAGALWALATLWAPQSTPRRWPIVVPVAVPKAEPVSLSWRKIAGESLYVTTIDLNDPHTFLSVGLANQASQANSARRTQGDEGFVPLVRRHEAAITASGTFFSMDAQKRVMGNLVAGGKMLKYSPWENYGTTLGIQAGNRPELVTARVDGKPQWQRHWFSLTAGPRLLRQGKQWIHPQMEGFTDRGVMEGKALRSAIGYPQGSNRLLLVTFLSPVSLQKEAYIMQHLGCHEAMNLDGGTSLALAKGNKILHSAGRELTNVITVYDVDHPAPDALRQSWWQFQRGPAVAMWGERR
jgi:Phosphodiester glycosidase